MTTTVHESVHVAQTILNWIGHHPRGTDEPTAYLVDWCTTQILGRLR